MNTLDQLQYSLGYWFKDLSILKQAVTHRSYVNEHPDIGHEA